MKNLVASMKRRIDPLSIYLKPEPLVDNFRVKIMSSGSCFAVATSEHFQRLGINSYFDLRTCFRFSARSFADYFQYLNSSAPDKLSQRLYLSGVAPYQLLRSTAHAEIVESPEHNAKLCAEIQCADEQFISNLQAADIVIFTLGTSIYLRTKDSQQVMNTNEGFSRESYEIVTPETAELNSDIRFIVENICKLTKPTAHIFFTVSPQRYSWVPMGDFRNGRPSLPGDDSAIPNDGLVNNCYDKSRMRVLLQDAIKEYSKIYSNISYFPSYEIVMDELRHLENFGVKEADFGHVSQDTSSHVINRFLNAYMSEKMQGFIEEFRKDESLLDQRFSYQNTHDYAHTIQRYMQLIADYDSLCIPQMYQNKIRVSIDKYLSKLDKDTAARMLALKTEILEKSSSPFSKGINVKCSEIAKLDRTVPIYMFGTGETAEEILKRSVILQMKFKGFVHSGLGAADSYFGFAVQNIDQVIFEPDAVVVIASLGSADIIADILMKQGVNISQMI